MPEERNGKDKEGPDSSGKETSHDQQEPVIDQHKLRKESPASNSEQKYFPLFSQSFVCSSEDNRGKGGLRKPRQSKINPPTFNYPKISDHFRPKTASRPNDHKDNEGRGREGGASCCKSVEFTTVTRPTDIPMSTRRRKY